MGKKTDVPTARMDHAISIVNGKIYAIGGGSKVRYTLHTVEAYNPETNTWTKKPDMPTARYFLSTSVVNDKIYAIGGSFGGPNQILLLVEECNLATDSWTKKSDMPTERFSSAACAVDENIYAIAGASGFNALPKIEIYDPKHDTWTNISSTFKPRVAS